MKLLPSLLFTGVEMVLMPVFMTIELGILYLCVGFNHALFGSHLGNMIGSIACGTVYMGFMYASPFVMNIYKKYPFWLIMLVFNPVNILVGWLNYMLDSVFIKFLFNQGDWGLAVGLKQQFVFIVAGSFGAWFNGIWPDVSAAGKVVFCYVLSWFLWIIFAYQIVRSSSSTDITMPNEYFIVSGLIQSMNFVHYSKNTVYKVYKYEFRNLVEQVAFVSGFSLTMAILQYSIVTGFSILCYPTIGKHLQVQNTQQLLSLAWISHNLAGRHIGAQIWGALGKIPNQNIRLIPYILIMWCICLLFSFVAGLIYHYFIFEILIVKLFGQADQPKYARLDQVYGIACGNFVLLYDGIQANCGGFWKVKKVDKLRESIESDVALAQDPQVVA